MYKYFRSYNTTREPSVNPNVCFICFNKFGDGYDRIHGIVTDGRPHILLAFKQLLYC